MSREMTVSGEALKHAGKGVGGRAWGGQGRRGGLSGGHSGWDPHS